MLLALSYIIPSFTYVLYADASSKIHISISSTIFFLTPKLNTAVQLYIESIVKAYYLPATTIQTNPIFSPQSKNITHTHNVNMGDTKANNKPPQPTKRQKPCSQFRRALECYSVYCLPFNSFGFCSISRVCSGLVFHMLEGCCLAMKLSLSLGVR